MHPEQRIIGCAYTLPCPGECKASAKISLQYMCDSKMKYIQNQFGAIGRVEKEGGWSVLIMAASNVL